MVWWINEDVLEATQAEFLDVDVEDIVSRGLDRQLDDPIEIGIFEFYLENCRAIAEQEEAELDASLAAAGV